MKKSSIVIWGLFLIGCGGNNDKDCNCSQQRWERKVVYTIALPQTEVSATEWAAVGSSENLDTDDCSKNGTKGNSSGSINAISNSDGTTYTVTQFEYRITCQ